MEKGKLGINLAAIAALSFVLAYLSWGTALILIVGIALMIEKNDWLSKQVIKAFYFCVGYNLLTSILNVVFDILYATIGNIDFIYSLLHTIDRLAVGLIDIGVLIICISVALKVFKGEDVTVPFVDHLVDQTLGLVKNINEQ